MSFDEQIDPLSDCMEAYEKLKAKENNLAGAYVKAQVELDIQDNQIKELKSVLKNILAEMGCDVEGKITVPQLGRIGNALIDAKEILGKYNDSN